MNSEGKSLLVWPQQILRPCDGPWMEETMFNVGKDGEQGTLSAGMCKSYIVWGC